MREKLAKQHADASKDTEDYRAKPTGSTCKDKWDSGKRYGILGDQSAKDVDAKWVGDSSLAGKTADDIEELYQQGRLNADLCPPYFTQDIEQKTQRQCGHLD